MGFKLEHILSGVFGTQCFVMGSSSFKPQVSLFGGGDDGEVHEFVHVMLSFFNFDGEGESLDVILAEFDESVS